MNFTSTDNKSENQLEIPYFEDSKAKDARYYASGKTVDVAMEEVKSELRLLGCYNLSFQEGYFGVGKQKRQGYLITFQWKGAFGKIPLAGLPLRNEGYGVRKQNKYERVRVQALLILRDHLISYRQSPIFMVNHEPMLQHLLGRSGRTLAEEYALHKDSLLSLPDVVDGEFTQE